jgi:hypothetical protein
MKYGASEIRKLTGKPTRAAAETALYASLEGRQWKRGERVYGLSGYDRRKGLVHFTATWPVEGGGVGHSRVGLALRLAVEGNGDLAQASILH